jgi:hypothetical protein
MLKEIVNNTALKMVILSIGLFFIAFYSIAQAPDYHPPMKIPMVMSGGFCESRSGHFHAGIDIKTRWVTGHELYAIEDAVLSRIKVEADGYGKALYLLHPDYSLSVYAHLQRFVPGLEKAVRDMQYHNKSFCLDTVLSDSLFVFNKGDCIGYSGNSGASAGPHLHFEIREMKTKKYVNPQHYWYFRDNVNPLFKGIVFYDLDANYKTEADRSDYRNAGQVRNKEVGLAPGKWGVGAEILDRMDGTHHRYGIVELVMKLDKDTLYHSKTESLEWAFQKYATTWYDAYFLETKNRHVQRVYRESGNKANLFVALVNDAVIELNKGDVKNIQLKARDAAGNWSDLNFSIKATDDIKPEPPGTNLYQAGKAINFPFESGFLSIPDNALYRDASVQVNCQRNSEGEIQVWNFTDHYYAFLEPVTLYLDGSSVQDKIKKYTVVQCKRDGKVKCITGKWDEPYFKIKTKKPGYFFFDVDSIPPRLYYSKMRDSINLSGYSEISYRVTDGLSGLKTYNAWIDDNWVLLQYEPKRKKLFYHFDEHIEKGKWHHWKIRVTDAVGNVREEESVFYY